MAQDPVAVDPHHYQVEFENDRVRVPRIKYGPGEKSAMHGHPDAVAVFGTDCDGKFNFPDGSSEPIRVNAGQTVWTDRTEHLPVNTSDQPLELVLVELKD